MSMFSFRMDGSFEGVERRITRTILRAETHLSRLVLSETSRLEKQIARLSQKKGSIQWAIGPVTNKPKKERMQIKITNEQQIKVTLSPKTDAGRKAPLDGTPTWEVISGEAELQVADDGLSALIVSSDTPGDTQILVKADADLGEGVEEISEILEVQTVGALAKNLGIVVGTAELKPTSEE